MAQEPKKDEFGIEIDEEVENILNNPKSGGLQKFLDYRDKRKQAERDKAAKEAKDKAEKENPGFFGGIFD